MQRFALFGERLGHSLSPQIHSIIARRLGIEATYVLREMPEQALQAELLTAAESYKGINVTIPYKTKVMPFLDALAPEAAAMGAVNTISFAGGRMCGYNTDWLGFARLLGHNGLAVKGQTAAVLGIGGASRAVIYYLAKAGAKEIMLVSRNPQSLPQDVLALTRGAEVTCMDYKGLRQRSGDLLINCTPVGMYPQVAAAPVDKDVVNAFAAVVDIIYNPAETLLLRYARELGKPAVNGLFMLTAQAVAAQEIWQERSFDDLFCLEITQELEKII